MKNLIVAILLGLLFSQTVRAQKESISMSDILSISRTYIDLVEMEMGSEIVRMEFDILSSTKTTYRVLTSDYAYGIFAIGDSRIADIDLKVYKYVNEQWTLVAKDDSDNSYALVTIEPLSTATYRIEISAYSFAEGHDVGHYGLLIYHP